MKGPETSTQTTAKEVEKEPDSPVDKESPYVENGAIRQNDEQQNAEAVDPNVVNFDGPDDLENPMNWPQKKKNITIALVTVVTLLSPIGSTIPSPAAADIMKYFGYTTGNNTLTAFITTIFLLGYTLGPILIAPLSEMYGRAILYKVCLVLYIIFNVACAVANSLGSLLVFRFLAGVAGSCPVTIGTGSISDLVPPNKRAGAMAGYVIGAVLGPSIGPICGGYLIMATDWRWLFWFMAIISGPPTILVILLIRESYPFVILQHKTERMRKETGNIQLRSALDTGRTHAQLFGFSILRPLKMLLLPIVLLLSVYAAVVYSYLYLCFTTFPMIFGDQYSFSTGASGLATLGLGVGSIVGIIFCGGVSDRLSAYLTKKHGGQAKPEYRLPFIVIGGFFVPIGLFWYAWTAEYKLHWILPIIGTGWLGAGMIITYMGSTLYLVDAYSVYSASVTASSTILRCLCATFLPLGGPPMYSKLGVGWGTSLLGFIAVAFMPLPILFYIFGQRIRETKRIQITI